MAEKAIVKTVEVNGNELDYAVFGSGKIPLIMIPGISIKSVILSAQAVAGAYSRYLENHTVYMFDRRRFAQPGYNIDDMGGELAEALNILGIKNADFFGTSQGGMIAQQIALAHPELVRRLVLACTASRPNEHTEKVITKWINLALCRDIEGLCTDFVNSLYSEAFAKRFLNIVIKMHSDCTDEEMDRFVTLARAGEEFDVYDKLGSIKCPTLVLGAHNDKVLTGRASEEIAEKIGCGIYMYGEPYGHAVYDEARDFKDRLFSFFNK